MYSKNRAWIELNLDHLNENLAQLRAILPGGCKLMPAVKANAYGHGAVPISLALQQQKISHFCVASAEEGIQLREAGILGEILILGYTYPEQFSDLFRYRLTQTVVDAVYARELSRFGKEILVHVGIDTGMHRLGERSENLGAILSLWDLPNLKITGLFSHLCVSDSAKKKDIRFTRLQIQRFQEVAGQIRRRTKNALACHLAGSYGILNYPDLSFDLARPGIALYGALSCQKDRTLAPFHPKPVLSLKSRIESLKPLHPGESAGYGLAYTAEEEITLAAVSIGYADGIPRNLSGKGHALIRGKKVPVAGRICMDQLLLDVSEVPEAAPGDEVVLIGNSGAETLTAEQMALEAGTISNEILSRLGERLPRIITAGSPPALCQNQTSFHILAGSSPVPSRERCHNCPRA